MSSDNEFVPAAPTSSNLELKISLRDYLKRCISEADVTGEFKTSDYASAIYDDTKLQVSSEVSRQKQAADYGLSNDASWTDILDAGFEPDRQHDAALYGLPADASWSEISKVGSEVSRQKQAADYGLSDDASWTDILDAGFERNRQHYAAVYGLPADSSWSEISANL
jgi:hypothetical protein